MLTAASQPRNATLTPSPSGSVPSSSTTVQQTLHLRHSLRLSRVVCEWRRLQQLQLPHARKRLTPHLAWPGRRRLPQRPQRRAQCPASGAASPSPRGSQRRLLAKSILPARLTHGRRDRGASSTRTATAAPSHQGATVWLGAPSCLITQLRQRVTACQVVTTRQKAPSQQRVTACQMVMARQIVTLCQSVISCVRVTVCQTVAQRRTFHRMVMFYEGKAEMSLCHHVGNLEADASMTTTMTMTMTMTMTILLLVGTSARARTLHNERSARRRHCRRRRRPQQQEQPWVARACRLQGRPPIAVLVLLPVLVQVLASATRLRLRARSNRTLSALCSLQAQHHLTTKRAPHGTRKTDAMPERLVRRS